MENNEVKVVLGDDKPFGERFAEFTSKAVSVAPLIAAVGIAVWWIFQGTIKIVDVQLGITDKIGLTVITIVMALSYRKLISIGGFEDGKKTTDYKEENRRWRESKEKARGLRSEINEFVKDECIVNLKALRKQNLENNGLLYRNILDENGNLIDLNYKHNKYNKKHNPNGYRLYQRRIIKKCLKMKIHMPDVFGVDNVRFFGVKKEETEKSFKARQDSTGAVITSVIAFFSTGIMFAWIGFSIGSVIYALFQVVLWTGTAVLQRLKNYNFVVRKLIPQIYDYRCKIDEYMALSDERKSYYKNIVIENENKKLIKLLPMKGEN